MCEENCVSFEVAKLLKDKGFCEWCSKCYVVAVLHNGVHISFDEECELKSEGRENEIEYVEGGILHNHSCNNNDKDAKIWAAPTIWDTMKWLREAHNIHIEVGLQAHINEDKFQYRVKLFNPETSTWVLNAIVYNLDTYEEACEAAIEYCLKQLVLS